VARAAAKTRRTWEEHARTTLSEAGHRAGGARAAVVELLAGQDCCLSAQEISEQLRGTGSGVGQASVYRALDLLYEMGLVQRVEIGDGGSRYEPVMPGGEHHHHAVCETCGKVTAFEDEKLERTLERLSGRLRHSMRAHDIVIRGDCSRCAKA
jgi:Fur family transcriptional regulator, ferric uptake regulator